MRSSIGIDIGGTNTRAARVTGDGAIVAHRSMPTPGSPQGVLRAIDEMVGALDGEEVAAIGIGVPGRVDVATGQIFSGGYVDLSGGPLGERLKQAGGRAVFADNDGNMAMVAEARIGAAKGLRQALLLTIGTGIGGAILNEARIFHGRATAGQLGHVVVDVNGIVCTCGRRGCIETMSSGTALRRLIKDAGFPASTTVDELLASEDAAAKAILEAWVKPLRAAIDSLVAAYDPQLVILGGGLGAAACRALQPFPPVAEWFQCDVAPAKLGDNAGVIGAALAALEHAP